MSRLSTIRPSLTRIVQARVERGWSQEEAAHEAGMSVFTLGKWERGERVPRGAFLRRYAEVTGRSVDWFFSEDAEKVA